MTAQTETTADAVAQDVPMDETEWLIRMAHLKAVEKHVKAQMAALKKNAPQGLAKGAAKLPDGRPVAVVTRKAGYVKYEVADPKLLRGFVADRHPDQLAMGVDPEFVRHLLSRARHETIPGIRSKTIAPTYEVDLIEDAFEEIWLEKTGNSDFAAMLDLT